MNYLHYNSHRKLRSFLPEQQSLAAHGIRRKAYLQGLAGKIDSKVL
jgi:hypothetical protein